MKNELGLIGNSGNLAWMERAGGAVRWLRPGKEAALAQAIPLPRPEPQEKLRSYFHYIGVSHVLETVYSSAERVFRQIDFFPCHGPWQQAWIRLLEPMKGTIPLHLRWPDAVLAIKGEARSGEPLRGTPFQLSASEPWAELLTSEVYTLKAPLAFAALPQEASLPPASLSPSLASDLFRDTEKMWKGKPLPQLEKKRVPELVLRSGQVVRLIGSFLTQEQAPAYLHEALPIPGLPALETAELASSLWELALALEGCGDDELSHLLDTAAAHATLPSESHPLAQQLLANGLPPSPADDEALAHSLQQLRQVWNHTRPPELNELIAQWPLPARSPEAPAAPFSPYLRSAHALGDLIEAGLNPWNDETWEGAKQWLQANGELRGEPQIQEVAGEERTVRPAYRRVRQELALSRLTHFRVMPYAVKNFIDEAARLASPLGLFPTYLGAEKEAYGFFPDPRPHARLVLAWLEGMARLAEAEPKEEVL